MNVNVVHVTFLLVTKERQEIALFRVVLLQFIFMGYVSVYIHIQLYYSFMLCLFVFRCLI